MTQGYTVYHLASAVQSRERTGMGASVYICLCWAAEYWTSQNVTPGLLAQLYFFTSGTKCPP